jgi:putative acetyltransferase
VHEIKNYVCGGIFFMEIKLDDLTGSEVVELVGAHLQGMAQHSPPESIHALNIEGLRKPEITFWSAWEHGELVGCGALKELDGQHGEIKSMRTSLSHQRKGVARRILQHIIDEAKRRGYLRLSLETGSMEAFEPAKRLYTSFGFQYCKPFSDYKEDPNSVFMTKEL